MRGIQTETDRDRKKERRYGERKRGVTKKERGERQRKKERRY